MGQLKLKHYWREWKMVESLCKKFPNFSKVKYILGLPWWLTVKHLPTVQETWVQSLGRENLLEKEIAVHSSILAWKIPWMEEPGRLQSMGLQRVGHNWVTSLHFQTFPKLNIYLPHDLTILNINLREMKPYI